MSETALDVDVAILGAGPAGLAAALRAKQAGVRVALFSKRRPPARRHGESLSPAAARALQDLGLWAQFEASGHGPCPGYLWSWGSDALEFHSFTRDPRGHAWRIDRAVFEAQLFAAVDRAGVERMEVRRTPSLVGAPGSWCIGWESDSTSEVCIARTIIDASGRGGSWARQLGIRRIELDRQWAHLAFLPASADRDGASLVEAVARGWWYAARQVDGSVAVAAFGGDSSESPNPREFLARLGQTRHVAARVRPGFDGEFELRRFDAGTSWLEPPARAGFRACGDAAVAYDPLAAHGLGFALASGRDAADSVVTEIRAGRDAPAIYARRILGAARRYREMRTRIYAAEQRWPQARFWQARQGCKSPQRVASG